MLDIGDNGIARMRNRDAMAHGRGHELLPLDEGAADPLLIGLGRRRDGVDSLPYDVSDGGPPDTGEDPPSPEQEGETDRFLGQTQVEESLCHGYLVLKDPLVDLGAIETVLMPYPVRGHLAVPNQSIDGLFRDIQELLDIFKTKIHGPSLTSGVAACQ